METTKHWDYYKCYEHSFSQVFTLCIHLFGTCLGVTFLHHRYKYIQIYQIPLKMFSKWFYQITLPQSGYEKSSFSPITSTNHIQYLSSALSFHSHCWHLIISTFSHHLLSLLPPIKIILHIVIPFIFVKYISEHSSLFLKIINVASFLQIIAPQHYQLLPPQLSYPIFPSDAATLHKYAPNSPTATCLHVLLTF